MKKFEIHSHHTVRGHRVTVWHLVGAPDDAYSYTATRDRMGGKPAHPGADPHLSFTPEWACNYYRAQLDRKKGTR